MKGRDLMMSDIHGMYHELLRLLRLVKYDPAVDTLTVFGDYIDRLQKGDRVFYGSQSTP